MARWAMASQELYSRDNDVYNSVHHRTSQLTLDSTLFLLTRSMSPIVQDHPIQRSVGVGLQEGREGRQAFRTILSSTIMNALDLS